MHKLLKKDKKGFTIIEVLIVLAIAGLILLIVFLAVPALQRNSRNTQHKNGIAAVMSAVNESEANNNGALPTQVAIATNGDISVTNGGTAAVMGKTQGGYTASVGTTAPTEPGVFVIVLNKKCNGNALATTTTKRAVAGLYVVETAGGTTPQCTES